MSMGGFASSRIYLNFFIWHHVRLVLSFFFFVVTVRDIDSIISTSVCFSLEYNNATEFLTLIL